MNSIKIISDSLLDVLSRFVMPYSKYWIYGILAALVVSIFITLTRERKTMNGKNKAVLMGWIVLTIIVIICFTGRINYLLPTKLLPVIGILLTLYLLYPLLVISIGSALTKASEIWSYAITLVLYAVPALINSLKMNQTKPLIAVCGVLALGLLVFTIILLIKRLKDKDFWSTSLNLAILFGIFIYIFNLI